MPSPPDSAGSTPATPARLLLDFSSSCETIDSPSKSLSLFSGCPLPSLQPMSAENIRILLIEDDPADADLVRETFSRHPDRRFHLECVDRLSLGLAYLASSPVDLVLLDLNLPDSPGLGTFERLHQRAPLVPIIILTGIQDEALAASTIQQGAQDYLVKGQVECNALVRSVSNAIERARLQAVLRNLSLRDELTGLHNRRGFRALVEQELRHSTRDHTSYLLLFADVDGLKLINDSFGHAEGDRALLDTAAVLKHSFRDSDVLARLGGDEFTAFAVGVSDHSGTPMLPRLRDSLDALNRQPGRRFSLSLSLGVAQYESDSFNSVDQLLATADQALYRQKRRNHAEPFAHSRQHAVVARSPALRREERR